LPAAESTGNYDVLRGWESVSPSLRRGTGFLSVGELANVRHWGATKQPPPLPDGPQMPPAIPDLAFAQNEYSPYRMDVGMTDAPPGSQDYVGAVARLVALGDWVTVRSHVFTVYGTLRGQPMSDVNERALRFQETLDRLPTFLGERKPVRIGERIVGRYADVQSN
jgi:hypothetical protein